MQYKTKYDTLLSARFYKIDEEDQRNNEKELFDFLNNNNNITEPYIDNIDNKSKVEHQIQIHESTQTLEGWRFDKIKSMKISFHRTGELNCSSYVNIPVRFSAMFYFENNDK